LAELKQKVEDVGLPVFEYPCEWDAERQRLVGLEEFGEQVYQDLMDSVEDEFPEGVPEELDWFAEENAAMEAFVEERTQRYVEGSRRTLLDEMTEFAEGGGEPSLLVVTGEPGSGKSALLGKFYRDYLAAHVDTDDDGPGQGESAGAAACPDAPDEIIIPHFVGASQGSTSIRQTLRRLCHEVTAPVTEELEAERQARIEGETDPEARAQIEGEYEIPEDYKSLPSAFAGLVSKVAQWKPVVIIIDALNQLDAADNAHTMNWLPRELPEGVRVVCSSLEHPALEALRRREQQVSEVVCAPLTAEDSGAIMDGFLARYRKRFDEAQREALLGKAEAHSPLYLLVALEELRTLGTYEEITARIEELPGRTTELFDWILRRLEEGVEGQEAFGAELVSAYTSYIAIGRGGMTEGELEALCTPFDEENEFWVLHRMLRPYLMQRGELADYFHGQLREAAEARYLDEHARCERHREVAEHFERRGYEYTRTLGELPCHLTYAEMWQELEEPLTDLTFIEAKCTAGMTHELVEDYNRVRAGRAQPRPPIRTAWLHEGRHGIWCPFCLAWSEIGEEQLGEMIDCPACGRRLRINPFVIEAQWQPCGPQKEAPADERTVEADLSPPVHEFADFVRGEAHIVQARPDLVMQEALNYAEDVAPTCAASQRQEGDQCIARWIRWINKPDRLDPCLATLEGHGDDVNACSFSPDGGRIVSASDDATVKVWDADSGAELATLEGHEGRVNACSFSPDGARIVSGSYDKTVKVWDADSGAELATLEGHGDPVWACSFSPDGARIVSGSRDRTLKLWDADSGGELATLEGHGNQVWACSFSPDDARIVSGSQDKALRLWDADSGGELAMLEGHGSYVKACSFSSDGAQIVSASHDDTVKLWDADSGAELATLEGHEGWLNACSFSPDGARIVSASSDRTLKVWDAHSGAEVATLEGHGGAVNGCSFSPDGARIVSGSSDHSLKLWDAHSGAELATLGGHSHAVHACTFSPNGRRIVSGGGWLPHRGCLKLWDAHSGAELATLREHGHRVWACSFSPDGERIVSGGGGFDYDRDDRFGELKVWDAHSGAELATLEGHWDNVWACTFSPDGARIVSGSWDQTLKIWDAHSGEDLATLEGHGRPVGACSFSPDGARIVSASWDKTLKVWDAHSGAELATLEGHANEVRGCSFSPDGARIVSGSADETVKLWDAHSGAELATLEGHRSAVQACSFSPDGARIVSASYDHTVKVWDAESGEEVGTFYAGGRAYALAVSGEGRRLAAGDGTGVLYRLRLEGFEMGPPILTGVRLWLFDHHDWDDKLTAMCPFHGGRFEVTEMMLGEEVPCPECGETLKLNPFVVTGGWLPAARTAPAEPVAAAETGAELRYWLARPGGQPKGPYRASTVRQAYQDGKLPGDALVCEHGATDWMTLAEAGLA